MHQLWDLRHDSSHETHGMDSDRRVRHLAHLRALPGDVEGRHIAA